MATSSAHHGNRDFGDKAFDNGSRFRMKGARDAPWNKNGGINNYWANDSRVPWKRPAFDGKMKRPWRPNQDQKVFEGSTNKGQGFALWRKKKIQSDYETLLRKQNKPNTQEASFSDHYPEHLKHLYEAEEEKLKIEEQLRKTKNKPPETADKEEEVIPKETFKKKIKKKSAYEIYEQVQQEREKKREEAENKRKQREEARKLYLQKRKKTNKVLSAKTKKGQPNFNVQMEYLLQKIKSKSYF